MDHSRFLITGLPRCRTTWLTVLFNTLGITTLHERSLMFDNMGELSSWLSQGTTIHPRGFVDGFATIAYPTFALQEFNSNPIVLIKRDFTDAVKSWQAWSGYTLVDATTDRLLKNYVSFLKHLPAGALVIDYTDLDNYGKVSDIVRYCVNRELPEQLFKLLSHMKIELHLDKSRSHAQKPAFLNIE